MYICIYTYSYILYIYTYISITETQGSYCVRTNCHSNLQIWDPIGGTIRDAIQTSLRDHPARGLQAFVAACPPPF